MMSDCAVGSGKRSRRDWPAAIFASIALNVAVVAAMRSAGGGTPGGAGVASAGVASAALAATRLPAQAMTRNLARIDGLLEKISPPSRLPGVNLLTPPWTLDQHPMRDK